MEGEQQQQQQQQKEGGVVVGEWLDRIEKILYEKEVDVKIEAISLLCVEWKEKRALSSSSSSSSSSSPSSSSPSSEKKEREIPLEWPNPNGINLVEPFKVKSGSKKALIHSLIHAEYNACSLMLDIILRFFEKENLPLEFIDDWLLVASEEVKHFSVWREVFKKQSKGKEDYGSITAHNSLWDSALDTSDSLLARLSIVHGVHEARGLDVSSSIRAKLMKSNDQECLAILENNVRDECGHVFFALKWLNYLCERDSLDPKETFQSMVKTRFRAKLKPPFNHELRKDAGFPDPSWYEELAKDEE